MSDVSCSLPSCGINDGHSSLCDKHRKRDYYRRNREELVHEGRSYYQANRSKILEGKSKRYQLVKSQVRSQLIFKKYGITSEEYDQMIVKQGSVCAICRTSHPGGNAKYFHIDHCHQSGRVRGLLCTQCNLGLGYFKDSQDNIVSALKYLENQNGR